MNTSFYKMAEQVKSASGKGELEEIIEAVRQSYATVVKMLWFENKKNELSEIDGAFIYPYKNLIPVKDPDTDYYGIEMPSSMVSLPHEMGIVSVSFMKSQDMPFVRIAAGAIGLWSKLKAFALGGNQVYFTDGKSMVFPKMKSTDVGNILLKLAIGVDGIDAEESLNIPLDVQDMIVQSVTQKFNPKPDGDQTLNNG